MKEQKEKIIGEISETKDQIIREQPEENINEHQLTLLQLVISKFDRRRQEEFKNVDESIRLIGGSDGPQEVVIPYRRNPVKRNVMIGALIAAAAVSLMMINASNYSNAGENNGIFHFFNRQPAVLDAYVKTDDFGTYHYKTYEEVPTPKRKYLFKFEHDTLPLRDIEIFTSESLYTYTMHFREDAEFDPLTLSIALDIPSDDKQFGLESFADSDEYEYQSAYKIGDTDMTISKATTPRGEDERDEYKIRFYDGEIIYSVSGNLPLYELEGIAAQYLEWSQK